MGSHEPFYHKATRTNLGSLHITNSKVHNKCLSLLVLINYSLLGDRKLLLSLLKFIHRTLQAVLELLRLTSTKRRLMLKLPMNSEQGNIKIIILFLL